MKSKPVSSYPGLTEEQAQNSFTDADLESMAHGNNPRSNAFRELLARRKNVNFDLAIETLRQCAAKELDSGYRAHHNALIYAANELENAQALGQEVNHES